MVERTQVAIIGAGPAGLLLGHLLRGHGIESVVLERRSRHHIEHRIRAGVLEQATVDVLEAAGLAGRLRREGMRRHGIELRVDGRAHRIALSDLTGGRALTIYGQAELVKDLVAARLAAGDDLRFEVDDVRPEGVTTDTPSVRFRHDGRARTLRCDLVAGCDGFHGASRAAIPAGALRVRDRRYPFAWLGILADVAPSTEEVVYARHDRGFALHSMRSPQVSRLYLQCGAGDRLDAWPDERIWAELRTRLGRDDGWELADGPIVDRAITEMRAFVVEPMRYGRLVLAGDAAHIMPPTGAKGLNLAVADVAVLAEAIAEHQATGDEAALDAYSQTALRRVWRTVQFCCWMTDLLHRDPGADAFERGLRRAQLERLCASEAAARAFAERYVGPPLR